MSEYKNFREEVLIRTKSIWDEYLKEHNEDGFEITLAINILSMVLLRLTGIEEEYGQKPSYDEFSEIINTYCTTYFVCADVNKQKPYECDGENFVSYLRNGFAHIHIYPYCENGKISKIEVRSRKSEPYFIYSFEASKFCDFVNAALEFAREQERKMTGEQFKEGEENGNPNL